MLLVASLVAFARPPVATAQTPVEPLTIHPNLAFPAGIAFDSSGAMYFTERGGRVRVSRDGRLVTAPVASARTTTAGETGFLGLTVSPDDRWVYVFATEPSGGSNSILRTASTGGELEPVVTGLPGGGYHNGGGVAFDAAGRLLVSNGETHASDRAQDPGELGGKVYRFTDSGKPAPRNPFGTGNPTYALGLRNPYGLAIDPVSGAPFVTENGPSAFDEVNRIEAGGNYGWPAVSGPARDVSEVEATLPGRYHDPLLDYRDSIVPTGITFAPPDELPGEVAGDLFFGAFGERSIHRVELDGSRTAAISDEIIWRDEDPVIAVAWGPRGLYYSTPSAIKLIPLAESTSTSGPTAVPEDEEGFRWDRILVTILGVMGAGGLLLVTRKKKGRA